MDNETEQLCALFQDALPDITETNQNIMTDANTQWRGDKNEAKEYVALLRPQNELQLKEIFSICAKHNVGVVPRAGGTALTNGSTISPEGRGKPCVLVQPNFKRKLDIKLSGNDVLVTVSPDITAHDIETDPRLAGKYKVPVDLGIGSKGKDGKFANIVGYLANNAAGTGAAFHGRAFDMVEHVRAIKADGSAWEMKNGDPELNELVGMGGTTGFITEATIRLIPVPKNTAVMALRLENIKEMYDLLEECKKTCWGHMQMFERMNDDLFQEVAEQIGLKNHKFTNHLNSDPKNKGDIIFIQLGCGDEKINLKQILRDLTKTLDRDVTPLVPLSKGEQKLLLDYRVINASAACERYKEENGGKVVAFDISVPPGDTDPFPSEKLITKLEKDFPGIKIFSFGHAAGVEKTSLNNTQPGRTAVHFNLILANDKELKKQEQRLREMVYAEISARGGKIVSEHAVGTKLIDASQKYAAEEYDHHLALNKKHDPHNILNPNAFVYSY